MQGRMRIGVRFLGKAPCVRLHHNVCGAGLAMSPRCAAVVCFGPGVTSVEGVRSVWGCLFCVHVEPQ
jgi:hypothetical protein